MLSLTDEDDPRLYFCACCGDGLDDMLVVQSYCSYCTFVGCNTVERKCVEDEHA